MRLTAIRSVVQDFSCHIIAVAEREISSRTTTNRIEGDRVFESDRTASVCDVVRKSV